MSENREYKSDVFSMLLEDPANALSVYNALNGTDYSDPAGVTMERLEQGISLSMRNDAAFVIDYHINIYEHQASYNPNMPIRSLFYYTEIIRPTVKGHDIYSRKQIKLATPHFVVFYNGSEKRPEREILRLSDAFTHKTDMPELELICTVYNINPGMNQSLLSQCPVLSEYMHFVTKVKENIANAFPLEEAIQRAIHSCIKDHILEGFLQARGTEVMKVMALDYTWERREKLIRKEEREDAREEVRAEVQAECFKEGTATIIRNMLKHNYSPEAISECTEQPLDYVYQIQNESVSPPLTIHEKETTYGTDA